MCVFHNTTWHCWCSPKPSGLRALLFINTGCSVQVVAFFKPVAPLASILNNTSYVFNFYMNEGQKTLFEKRFLFKREEKKKPKAKQTKKRKVFGLNKHYKTTNREKRLLMLYIKKQSLPLATVWHYSENKNLSHRSISTGCLYKIFIN